MFKKASFEDEIYQSMEKQLVSNQVENTYGFKRLAQATDYLNAAAEIFEQAGMTEQSKEITEVLQELAAAQLSSKAFSLSDLEGVVGMDKGTLHSILESSSPAQLMHIAKKVLNIVKGDSTIIQEISSLLKEHDLSDPAVRGKVIKKLMLALQLAKFFA